MNGESSPLVSIVIPVYNGANYLRAAIASALAQTYPHVEVLVVNDGSDDGGETERIALSYGGRIRYFAKENGGVASALNRGLREMNGACFVWLSHDDLFLPEKIARQVDFLQKNEATSGCYTDYFRIDANGRITKKIHTPWLPRKKALKMLFGRQYINGSTMMVKRECFDQVGMFAERWRYTQDMEMWFRLLQNLNIGHVAKPLAMQRFHGGQGSCERDAHQREARELLEFLFDDLGSRGLLDNGKKTTGEAERLARRHIWFGRVVSRGRGWYDTGDAHLKKALSIWPSAGNPARLHLLLNRLTPLHHRLQHARVRLVHWLAVQARALGLKR